MTRPKGTGKYPSDPAILAEIRAAYQTGSYTSKTKAIEPFLDRIEGDVEPESKRRRMLRQWDEADRAQQEVTAQELAKALSRLPTMEERVRYLAQIERSSKKVEAALRRAATLLQAHGIDTSSDPGKTQLLALLLAEFRDSRTDKN